MWRRLGWQNFAKFNDKITVFVFYPKERASFSETVKNFYQTTRYHIIQDSNQGTAIPLQACTGA